MHSSYLKAVGYLAVVLLLAGVGWGGPLYESGVVVGGEEGCLTVGVWGYELCTDDGCGQELGCPMLERVFSAGRGAFAWCVVVNVVSGVALIVNSNGLLYLCLEVFSTLSAVCVLCLLLSPPFFTWCGAHFVGTVYRPSAIHLYLTIFIFMAILKTTDDDLEQEAEEGYNKLPVCDDEEEML